MRLRLAIAALVIGNPEDAHFAAAVEWLAQNVPSRFLPDAFAAIAGTENANDVEPALVVLLQSRPGEFTEAEIGVLRRRWPLTRFVAIVASWCAGEPRTGRPLCGVQRIPWHAARERLSAELGLPSGKDRTVTSAGSFDLPATATSDERLLANVHQVAAAPATVAVAAIRASVAEPLVDALAAAGHTAVYWPLPGGTLVRGIAAVVWDTFGCESRLEEIRRALPAVPRGAPVVAIADFPRPQDASHLAELGVERVLGKPLLMADLLRYLDETLAPAGALPNRDAAVA